YTHYDALIEAGLLGGESGSLALMWITMGIQFAVAVSRSAGIIGAGIAADASTGGASVGLGTLASAVAAAAADAQVQQGMVGGLSSWASALSAWASYERREQEWNFQRDLAEIDQDIANAQIDLADDRYDIVEQEQTISIIGRDNARDTVTFLQNKFTNVELYDFMGGVVSDAYKYFLQQATAMARMAQRQLVFERQEAGLDFILSDYWTAPGTNLSAMGDNAPDRRGMTGSTRLVQDITKLDQFAFTTDRRRHQISKTISLALHNPDAFQQFRISGVLPFATPMELFDRDFPGHYLRLIKRARVSVLALIPPTEGIKATLSATGISRVVRGESFELVDIIRQPDSVALSAATNAIGVFELQEQPEMLLPFEGSGVDCSWELRLPKAANRFDFTTIADVLVTIDYTALDSPIYRDQVTEAIGTDVSAMRAFSLRRQFADAWYDLHHPELLAPGQRPMSAAFHVRPQDYPPNVSDIRIRHVELFIGFRDDATVPMATELLFAPDGAAGTLGGPATGNEGFVSTRRGNAGSWMTLIGKAPFGRWELRLRNDDAMRALFREDQVTDIVLVITYSGQTPPWPPA
ncbi:MAG: hypothetical protein ACREEP_15025, partial [Dongiaceae bacterium]